MPTDEVKTISETPAIAAEEQRSSAGSIRPKVLLVDDVRNNLLAMEKVLSELNADTIKAESGEEALSQILRHEIAVVLMDVHMPGMDGHETASLIRGNEDTRHIPTIFVTGVGKDESCVFRGYEAGAVDYLLKPINPDILRSKVNVFLELYRRQKALDVMKDLQREVERRKRIEEELRQLNDELENRVAERTSQLESANKELEAFSYSVSHDLRAPLRAINGFCSVLLEDHGSHFNADATELFDRVRNASSRMSQLIDGLLDLSRLNRVAISFAKVDLSAIALEISEQFKEQHPDHSPEIVIPENISAIGDASLLTRVLDNLMGNAWKFTSKRENARIEFGVKAAGRTEAYYVADNGAGFDQDYASQLFLPFRRLHTENEFPGSGIGLATVQRIVHRHGGRIWAEGKTGKGATFYFTLRNWESRE